MYRKRFFDFFGPISVFDIAKLISAEIENKHIPTSKETLIYDIKNIEDATEGDLAFVSNKKYHNFLKTSKASCCIISEKEDISDCSSDVIFLKAADPYYAYSKVIKFLYSEKKSSSKNNVSKKAYIAEDVKLGFNVIIEDDVEIQKGTIIGHNVVIKNGCKIGKNSVISDLAYIAHSVIGDNVIIHPGVKIGTDGFGFATNSGIHHKILHIGSVIIGNNVEIGANSTIDRGSNKDTIIGEGTIMDNLVQVGHNAQIGRGCIIVAQVGIAGSASIGDYVVIGGQAGIAGHIKIASGVQIAGKAGVISDIATEKQIVGGYPSQPIREWHKQTILLRKMLNDSKK